MEYPVSKVSKATTKKNFTQMTFSYGFSVIISCKNNFTQILLNTSSDKLMSFICMTRITSITAITKAYHKPYLYIEIFSVDCLFWI
jgi:hypothetical protein